MGRKERVGPRHLVERLSAEPHHAAGERGRLRLLERRLLSLGMCMGTRMDTRVDVCIDVRAGMCRCLLLLPWACSACRRRVRRRRLRGTRPLIRHKSVSR